MSASMRRRWAALPEYGSRNFEPCSDMFFPLNVQQGQRPISSFDSSICLRLFFPCWFLKGVHHYWTYFYFFQGTKQQLEVLLLRSGGERRTRAARTSCGHTACWPGRIRRTAQAPVGPRDPWLGQALSMSRSPKVPFPR